MSSIIVVKRKWNGAIASRWPARAVAAGKGRIAWLTPVGTVRERPGRRDGPRTVAPERGAATNEWWVATLVGVGPARRWKIDAATPPRRGAGEISFVDLDLDVVVGPGRRLVVRDVRQFVARVRRERYPVIVVGRVCLGLAQALLRVALRRWPFDGSLEGLSQGGSDSPREDHCD